MVFHMVVRFSVKSYSHLFYYEMTATLFLKLEFILLLNKKTYGTSVTGRVIRMNLRERFFSTSRLHDGTELGGNITESNGTQGMRSG